MVALYIHTSQVILLYIQGVLYVYHVPGPDSPQVCTLYSSCSGHQVDNTACPVTVENLLAVKLFTPANEECRNICRNKRGASWCTARTTSR